MLAEPDVPAVAVAGVVPSEVELLQGGVTLPGGERRPSVGVGAEGTQDRPGAAGQYLGGRGRCVEISPRSRRVRCASGVGRHCPEGAGDAGCARSVPGSSADLQWGWFSAKGER
jgi:hypothetical protein